MDWILTFLSASWAVFGAMAPYLLLGFGVAGLLSVFISAEWVERHLGGSGFGQVVKASLFGVPLPLCSCGVIPVAASLRRHGASKGATTAFLLSTPQTGVDSIAVTYALLGPFLAVVRPVAAFITGIFGGGLVQAVERNGAEGPAVEAEQPVSTCCDDDSCELDGKDRPKIVEALHYGLVTLPRDIGRALIFGVIISGLIATFVAPQALESTSVAGCGRCSRQWRSAARRTQSRLRSGGACRSAWRVPRPCRHARTCRAGRYPGARRTGWLRARVHRSPVRPRASSPSDC